MANQGEISMLGHLAQWIAREPDTTLKIAIVDNGHAAGVLHQLLTRKLHLPKNKITELGYTASDDRNDALLRRRNAVVIVPSSIFNNRPCRFHMPQGCSEAVMFYVAEGKVADSRFHCSSDSFTMQDLIHAADRQAGRSEELVADIVEEQPALAAEHQAAPKSWWRFWR